MMIQNRELEELQARIREAEERLKARESNTARGNDSGASAGKREGEYQRTGEDNA